VSVIYLKSAYDAPSETVAKAAAEGLIVIVEQTDLTGERLLASRGLVTGNQLDQNAMLGMREALAAFLDGGGRWFFNGHIVRPLLDGMAQYRPIDTPRRADFVLTSINPHSIFAGIDLAQIETNKGVAGFYGRGCNPLPEGAVAVNGLGEAQVPVDWVWARPGGGRVFSHAGNDLGAMGQDWGLAPELTQRILDWAGGAPCLDPARVGFADPAGGRELEAPEDFGGSKSATAKSRRIVAPSAGSY
jgi:hypothetical protein